jgi:hypothetical protein
MPASIGAANGETFHVGNDRNGSSIYDGKIGLLRMWSTTRTNAELQANACSLLGATTSLEGEWGFNDAYTDNSGSGNDLTGVNSPVFATDVPTIECGTFQPRPSAIFGSPMMY